MLIAGTPEFLLFCMILMRMSGFVFFQPIFGRNNIPAMFRTGLAMILTILVYFVERSSGVQLSEHMYPIQFGILLLKEYAVGYVLGFVMVLFDYVVIQAGAVMDFQMGLSMATVYDAQNGSQIALTGRIFQIYYTFLFFAVDGHLAVLKIITSSADVMPYGSIVLGQNLADVMVGIFIECSVLAMKLAFPLIAIEFIAQIAIGMLMKIIPQINLFVLNIELKVIIGILVLVFLISPIGSYLNSMITDMVSQMQNVLSVMAG